MKIAGERRREEHTEEQGYFRRELSYGRFERSVGLPAGVDAESVKATYDAGILEIVVPLPRKPSSKVKVELGPHATPKELN